MVNATCTTGAVVHDDVLPVEMILPVTLVEPVVTTGATDDDPPPPHHADEEAD